MIKNSKLRLSMLYALSSLMGNDVFSLDTYSTEKLKAQKDKKEIIKEKD